MAWCLAVLWRFILCIELHWVVPLCICICSMAQAGGFSCCLLLLAALYASHLGGGLRDSSALQESLLPAAA